MSRLLVRLRMPVQVAKPAAAPAGGPVPERFAYLDSLRGLAAVWIMVCHLVYPLAGRIPVPEWVQPPLRLGSAPAALFFVVSAFTLCHMHAARRGEPRATARFYVRRALRVVPLYYAWLAAMAYFTGASASAELLAYATFVYNIVPGWESGLVEASWTLAVEIPFYLIFPAVAGIVTGTRQAAGFLAVSLVLAYVHFRVAYAVLPEPAAFKQTAMSFFRYLPSFAAGMLAYHAQLGVGERFRPHVGAVSVVAAIGGFLVLVYSLGLRIATPPSAAVAWLAVPAAGLTALLAFGLALRPVRLLVNRPTAAAGTISYSLYLNHPLLLGVLAPVYLHVYGFGWPPVVSLTACIGITLVPLVGGSVVTYRLIERPGMAVGRRLARRLR